MGITREQVWTTCDTIWAEGKQPSNQAVRAMLGTGSFSTISKLIREWKQDQAGDAVTTGETVTPPPEIQELFNRAYTAVINTAQAQENNQRVELLEQENEQLRSQLAELEGLRTAHQQLLDKTIALATERANLIAERDAAVSDSVRNRNQLDQAQSEVIAALKELGHWQKEAEMLAAQNQELIARFIDVAIAQQQQPEAVTNAAPHQNGNIAEGQQAEKSESETVPASDQIDSSATTEPQIKTANLSKGLTQAALAKRLNMTSGNISKSKQNRSKKDFAEWSQRHDPDGIAWEQANNNKYYPIVQKSANNWEQKVNTFVKDL